TNSNGLRAATCDQDGLVPASLGDPRLDRGEGVVDVDEVAAAFGVADDHDRLALEGSGGERGDRARRTFPGDLAGPVHGGQPGDERRGLMQAAGLLVAA